MNRRRDPILRAYDDGVEQGARDASPGECPFRDPELRLAWLTGCVHGRAGIVRPTREPIRDDGAWAPADEPSLRPTSSLECALCNQLRTTSNRINDSREIEMFGAARYAWCILCKQHVVEPWLEDYKRRWDLLHEDIMRKRS